MTPSDIQPWLSVAALLISIGGTAYAWLTAGSKTNSADIAKLTDRVQLAEKRIDRVEVDMRHLPDQEHAQRTEISLAELRGQVAILNERLMPIAEMARRVHERMFEAPRA